MLGFPVGVFAANAFEWYAHKVWLHEFPSKFRNSPFFTHIAHHKRARLNQFHDAGYAESMFKNSEMYNEKTALIGLAVTSTVFLPVAPFFTMGLYYGISRYWRLHSKAHLDAEWAKQNLPWHYEHHMNSNQNANWCVTRPWFDYIMGTRVIGDVSIAETNPLGMKLHPWVERPVNRIARRLIPKAYVLLDARREEEQENQRLGIEVPIMAS
ncbi:hypothetical protein [Aquirhabdus sp.]|uniref:hypothetical protein n=1 Tax=Aquirhabdus sp. TaxID=2824160 RepID=UPI00396C60DD